MELVVERIVFNFNFSELLYPEREPLPVPDCSDSRCALQLSAMCILIHILRKAQSDNLGTPQTLPPAFTSHHE